MYGGLPFRKNNSVGVALILVTVVCSVYGGTWAHGFALDDYFHILSNPALRTWAGVVRSVLHPTYPGNLYRPVPLLTYAVTYQLVQLNPLLFHLSNLALHALVAFMVWELLRVLFDEKVGLFSALIFAVHPLHTEAVVNVVGRAELLSATFVLVALRLAISEAIWSKRRGVLTSLMFFLGLCSKESAFCGLLLLPLTWWSKRQLSLRCFWGRLCWFVAGAILYLLLRLIALDVVLPGREGIIPLDNPLIALGLPERLFNGIVFLGRYLVLAFAPVHLSADYSPGYLVPYNWLDIEAWGYFLVAALWFMIGILGVKYHRPEGFFCLWFLAAFSVTSNLLFPIGTHFGERLTYLPLLGVVGIYGLLLLQLRGVFLRSFLGLVLLLMMAGRAWVRVPDWKNNVALYRAQINISPESARTQYNYAVMLQMEGQQRLAARHLSRALEIYPAYAQAAWALGNLAIEQGDLIRAKHWYHHALNLDPAHRPSWVSLGYLFLSKGQSDVAQQMFEAALKVDASDFEAQVGMLEVLVTKQDLEQAIRLRDRLVAWDDQHQRLLSISRKLDERKAAIW